MTNILKQLKERFTVANCKNNMYCLYEHNIPGKILAKKYIGTVCTDGKVWWVLNSTPDYETSTFIPTNDFETLVYQVYYFGDLQNFDIEFYNPNFAKGEFEKLVVGDYMHSIGFERESGMYECKIDNIVTRPTNVSLSFNGLDNNSSQITIVSWASGRKFTEYTVERDAVKIIDTLNTVLNLTFGIISANVNAVFTRIGSVGNIPLEPVLGKFNEISMDKTPYTDTLIDVLEKLLNNLKTKN